MKRFIALMIALVLVASVFAGCGGKQEAGEAGGDAKAKSTKARDLRMNITTSETGTWMDAAEKFAELVEAGTDGRYIVSIYPSEQLSGGNQAKGVEMVQDGATDVDIHSTIIWSAVDQRLTVVNMPWLFTNYDEVDAAVEGGAGDAIMDIMKDVGVVPLAIGESGFRQITNSKHPIETPEDMVGIKLRVPGIAMYLDLFKLLGADPTTMNFGEVFTALQQGTIDGQENPLDVIYTNKIQEVQDYLTICNFSYDMLVFSVSEKLWDELSDADKEVFANAADEAMVLQKKLAREVNDSYLEELSADMEINELSPEQMQVFKDLAAPVYDQYRDVIGDDLYKAFGYEG